jgi:hypothetical protein
MKLYMDTTTELFLNDENITEYVDTSRPCTFDPISEYDYYFTNYDGRIAKTIEGECYG